MSELPKPTTIGEILHETEKFLIKYNKEPNLLVISNLDYIRLIRFLDCKPPLNFINNLEVIVSESLNIGYWYVALK